MPFHFAFVSFSRKPDRILNDPSFIYRCENISAAISSFGHRTSFIHLSHFSPLHRPDVVVFHRPRISRKLYIIIRILKSRGAKIVADVDDLIFDESFAEFSPAVINGIMPYKKTLKKFISHRHAMELFDQITVSTTALANHAKKIFKGAKISVIPNAVHHSWIDMKIHKEIYPSTTITYFPGTNSHDHDFSLVTEPLSQILCNYPNVRLLVTGPLKISINARQGQIVQHPKVRFSEFHMLFKRGAINLAPLESTPFNHCKSALKLIEAGWWGIPTVCSIFPDAERFFGTGAIGVSDEKEWYQQLEKLITDSDYYNNLTKTSHEIVFNQANVYKNAEKLIDFTLKDASISKIKNWKYFPAVILNRIANQQRTRGNYNQATLWLFRQSWRKSRSANNLMNYLLFRRDLGLQIESLYTHLLLKTIPHLPKRHLWSAAALLMEAGVKIPAKDFKNISLGEGLIKLAPKQSFWRSLFKERINRSRQDGIIVVGNAGALRGCALCETIDNAGMVIRFNAFQGNSTNVEDIGKKLDAWVCAPDFKGMIPQEVEWLLVSGPNMCYRKRSWKALLDRINSNLPILSIPLPVWHGLVTRLQAPPSAGVLTLAWLCQMIGSWEGITAIGIGSGVGGSYHYADAYKIAGKRHDWSAEQLIVQEWCRQGLRVLPK